MLLWGLFSMLMRARIGKVSCLGGGFGVVSGLRLYWLGWV